MKIGYDAKRLYHNRTGLGNYSRDLVRILAAYFPSNQYFLYNPKPKKHESFDESAASIHTVVPAGMWKKIKSIWRSYGLSLDAQTKDLDIYHGLSGELPLGLPRQVKKIVTIHDLIFVRYPSLYSFWDRKIHYLKFKSAAKRADQIIAISEQTKRDIVDFLKVDPSKIQVIYQGCSQCFKTSYSPSELEVTRGKYKLPKQFILNVGTVEVRKNALTLVKAVHHTNTTLVLIGKKTAYYQEIEQYTKREGFSERVVHLSNVSQLELAQLYQLATALVYPSIFEGFGIPIIEALFSRTPVITTNSGVFPEAAGPDSLYVDPHNIEAMSQAIEKLLSQPDLCVEMADRGWNFVQKFTDHALAKDWNLTYQNILKKN